MRKADFYCNTYEINDVSKMDKKELTEIRKKIISGENVRIYMPESEVDTLFNHLRKYACGKGFKLTAEWPVLDAGDTLAATTWSMRAL